MKEARAKFHPSAHAERALGDFGELGGAMARAAVEGGAFGAGALRRGEDAGRPDACPWRDGGSGEVA